MSESNDIQTMSRVDDLDPRRGEKKRVAVIGAGPAGLAAAYQLRHSGHEVVVLEARTRPGGRVHTVRRDFADDLHAESGPVFIPLEHEYLMKYVRLAGLGSELEPVAAEELMSFYYLGGRRYLDLGDGPLLWGTDNSLTPASWPGDLHPHEQRMNLDDLYSHYIDQIDGGYGNPEEPGWPPANLRSLDDQTMVECLRSLGASEDAVELSREIHLGGFGDNGHDISPLFALQQWADLRKASTAASWTTIKGGNDRWVRRLAAMLGQQIHYGAEVVSIDNGDEGVRLGVRRNGMQSEVEADYLICALPFSVLREIEIRPALSATKAKVITELESTPVSHFYIQCKRRVWRQPGRHGIFAISATDSELTTMFRDATFNQPGVRGVLDLYIVGSQTERMDSMDEEERARVAVAELDNVFPGLSEVAEGTYYQSWSQDRFSRGDYISYRSGQFNELWPHVATPEGRIHFAGDQTAVKSAWQEGAISSGHRAASEVARRAEAELEGPPATS